MTTEPPAATGDDTAVDLFLLRVWREGGRFRAVLRRVGRGEPQMFTHAAQVGDYLDRLPLPSHAIDNHALDGSDP